MRPPGSIVHGLRCRLIPGSLVRCSIRRQYNSSDVADTAGENSVEVEPYVLRTTDDLGLDERLQLVRTAPWAAFEPPPEENATAFKLGADDV